MIFKLWPLFISLAFLIIFQISKALGQSLSVHTDTNESCSIDDSSLNLSSTLIVGCISSLVFCFIGILPAFFIKTDADEEKFSMI